MVPLDCLLIVEKDSKEIQTPVGDIVYSNITKFLNFCENHFPTNQERLSCSKISKKSLPENISLVSVILATSLEQNGFTFKVVDGQEVKTNFKEKLIRELISSPVTIAVSTTHIISFDTLEGLLSFIRSYNTKTKIIVGGQFLAKIKDKLTEVEDAEVFVFGDGEIVLPEIVRRIKNGVSLEGINGVVYKTDRGYRGSFDPITYDLDHLPIPDWDLLRTRDFNDNYFQGNPFQTIISVEDGRGCRFRCSFCTANAANPVYRKKKVERIVQELSYYKSCGMEGVFFVSSNFLIPIKECAELCRIIADRELSLTLSGFGRIDVISKNLWLADLLKEAGFGLIYSGIESGDPGILKAMGKSNDPAVYPEIVSHLKKRGIRVLGSFVFGHPGETAASIEKTKKLLREANFDFANLCSLAPVKGCRLFENREQYGIEIDDDGKWRHETMSSDELPAVIEDVLIDMVKGCDTVEYTFMEIAPKFCSEESSPYKMYKIARLLQIAVANELQKPLLTENSYINRQKVVWKRLMQEIDVYPTDLAGANQGSTGR